MKNGPINVLFNIPAQTFNFWGYCVWAYFQWGLLSDQNLQLCLLRLFNSKVASSEKTTLKTKLGSSVFLIMTSQNSIRWSKSSSLNSCTRWILYGWNLIFFKILCTDLQLISCCWFALRILRWTFSTNDCATSNCFSSVADIGYPGIWQFFTLPVSLKRLTVRSTVDLEMAIFSSRKVPLKICLTSLYDLWRSPHPCIMRRDIFSRSER